MMKMLNKANQIHFYLNLSGLAKDSWQMELKNTKPIRSTWLDTTRGKLRGEKKPFLKPFERRHLFNNHITSFTSF